MAFAKTLGFLTLAVGALAAPYGPEHPALESRQTSNPHWYKYWANDKAVVEAQNLDGGKFIVEWDEPNGGNFVIGKGYQTGRET
jgi:hypothetical protein